MLRVVQEETRNVVRADRLDEQLDAGCLQPAGCHVRAFDKRRANPREIDARRSDASQAIHARASKGCDVLERPVDTGAKLGGPVRVTRDAVWSACQLPAGRLGST